MERRPAFPGSEERTMATPKQTYTSEQIGHMSRSVEEYKSALQQLKDGTRSAKIIDKVHEGLLAGLLIEGELKGAKRTDGYWEVAAGLEDRWTKTIEKMQNAEEEVRQHRQLWGWLWFWAFTLLLLAAVALYIVLHLRWRPTDSELFLWTGGRKQYAEVALWTFFGLLTWTVYSVQHWVRVGQDISVWSQWYLSKVLQGVPIALVLLIAVKQVDLGAAITDAIVPAIGGFILGYYSDRARAYLDRLRDKLFSDPSHPVVDISLPKDGSTSLFPKTVLRGQVIDAEVARATLRVNDGEPKSLEVDGNGNFSDTIILAQRDPNHIKVWVETAAKRTGSKTVIVYYPGPKPMVVIGDPKDGAIVNTSKVTVTGTIKDALDIPFPGLDALALRDGAAPVSFKVNGKGEFSQEVELAPGPNTIRVAAPYNGLVESAAVTVHFQPQSPAAPDANVG